MNDLKQLSKQFDLPFYETLSPLEESGIYEKVSFQFFKEHRLVPIKEDERSLTIAVSQVEKLDLLDSLVSTIKKEIKGVFASEATIRRALQKLDESLAESSEKVMDALRQEDFKGQSSDSFSQDLLDQTVTGTVVKLVNRILMEALQQQATDVHLEPYEKKLDVRFRVDGILTDWGSPPVDAQEAIVSRIKVMSGLNIAEKRLPQDGRTTIQLGEQVVDIRVSIIPTAFGERVVLRLLDKKNIKLKLEALGFSSALCQKMRSLIGLPHGIVLVTGPTGSGKTTTLYAALSYLQVKTQNIMTVEDPIEYRLNGISQMNVKPEIGLTFSSGLRALLRQDPDVLMVGEIRDSETARVAIQAALTGHLVLATLHTNDAPSALTRLRDIGIEPYLIASTVRGILAQRLVRLICSKCQGKGCSHCFETGYRGRTGIYELIEMDEKLKEGVVQTVPEATLRKIAKEGGMTPLIEDGLKKVASKVTTREEVLRVTS